MLNEWKWDYRLRLKKTYVVKEENKNRSKLNRKTKEEHLMRNVALSKQKVKTNIGILKEKGHKEAWMIAMGKAPTRERVKEYGGRWPVTSKVEDSD